MSALLRLSLLALATSSLTACSGDRRMWTEDEIRDVSRDVSDDLGLVIDRNAVAGNTLGEQVESLEAYVDAQANVIKAQADQIDALNAEVERLQVKHETHYH